MTKEQKEYLVNNYNFDENNKDIKYLYEISEEILSDECYYSQIDDLEKADFFYDLYEDFKAEYSKNGEIDEYDWKINFED